ncbi:hypothetical protein E8E12_001048, partial [Didymella heteroderae]
MDLNPNEQIFWRFLSLTAYNIQVESARIDPDLRRLVGLVNTFSANVAHSTVLEPQDKPPLEPRLKLISTRHQHNIDESKDSDDSDDSDGSDYPDNPDDFCGSDNFDDAEGN